LNISLKFEKSTEILDDIIKCQISPLIRTSHGYDQIQMTTHEDSKSRDQSKKVDEGKSKIYVDVLKIFISDEENRKRENDIP
jgi:hypothetical protein